MSLPGNISVRTAMEICVEWAVALSCWNHSELSWQRLNLFHRNVSSIPVYHSPVTVCTLSSKKQTSNSTRRNCTPRCHFRTMQWALVRITQVICNPKLTILFIRMWKWASFDNRMSSQCCDCCSPRASKNWVWNWSWFTLSSSLSSWETWICRDGNACFCAEFTECYCILNQEWELAIGLTHVDLTTWLLLLVLHCQVYALNIDVLDVYCTSPIVLDAFSVPTTYCG
jgi:hypothetical protein